MCVLIAGCDSAGGDADKDFRYRTPEITTVPLVDASVRLPFDDYEMPVSERVRLQEGESQLLKECMIARGFDIELGGDFIRPPDPEPELAFADTTMWGGPFGTMPLEHAQRFGYKPAPDGPFVKGPGFYWSNLVFRYLDWGAEGADPAAESAFYADGSGDDGGVDEDPGCLAEVGERLGPLVDTTDYRSDLSKLAREHPRVEAATQAWTVCMRGRGYRYSDVWKASARYGMSAVDKRQIKVAVDDVECTAESGWANYYYAVLADYQRQALEHDPTLMESAFAAEKARLAAVERELAG